MTAARHLEAREAEQAVLGAILLDNTALDRIGDVLDAEDFYAPRNRMLYEQMLLIAERNEPIDHVSLTNALEQNGDLDAVGGMDYILELDRLSGTTVNIQHHAKLVHGQPRSAD